MRIPEKVKATGLSPDLRRQFNIMVDFIKSLRPLDGNSVQIDRTSNGFFTRPKGGKRVSGGDDTWY